MKSKKETKVTLTIKFSDESEYMEFAETIQALTNYLDSLQTYSVITRERAEIFQNFYEILA